ncbi:MAG: sugar phosphate isomerase/epimerase [Acidobacteriota bacterium]|nr:sugar phosphate isomerase/epimerase [Acidobacteriota bacterium]
MNLRYAYNTNGAANHRLEDALSLIADSGYAGVALTLDHHHFDPFADDFENRAARLARDLEKLQLGLVVETGARFLLDPRAKHEPTLLSPSAEGRKKRVSFLKRAVDLAAFARAEAVSFWAGVKNELVSVENAQIYLRMGLREICEYAEAKNVCLALEPEPGMLIETVSDYKNLSVEYPSLKIALDTGHCLASDEGEPANAVLEMRGQIGTVAIEDMRRGVHEHLFFGEGEMNIAAVLNALHSIKYRKLLCVELSRHSHCADKIIPAAIEFLLKTERELDSQAKESAA